jgi:hypothetical protein
LKSLQFGDPLSIRALVHPQCVARLGWQNQVLRAAIELVAATPAGSHLLLVDEAQFDDLSPLGRTISPFTEARGVYGGPPADSQAAIEELERKRGLGANAIAFAWPAFWWLDHYQEFARHLHERYRTTLDNDRWIVFDLSGR